MLNGQEYDTSTDFWSVGILMFEMIMGVSPFQHRNTDVLKRKICNDKIRYPGWISAPAIALMKGLLQRDTTKRFTMEQIKAHPYFHGLNWKELEEGTITPPFKPSLVDEFDVTNFDQNFTNVIAQSPAGSIDPTDNETFKNFSFIRDSPHFTGYQMKRPTA